MVVSAPNSEFFFLLTADIRSKETLARKDVKFIFHRTKLKF